MKEIHRVAPTSPQKYRYNTRANTINAQNEAAAPEVQAASTKPADASQAFDWRNSTLMVEFKRKSCHDPFKTISEIKKSIEGAESECKVKYDSRSKSSKAPDHKPTQFTISDAEAPVFFEKDSVQARYTLGQLAIYASSMFGHQQRTHLFQLFIAGHIARFIFFDHSGAIVSDAVDYVKDSDVLVEFFWRLNHMSKVARGWDPTALLTNNDEIKRFNEVVNKFLQDMNKPGSGQRLLPNAELTLSPDFDVFKMLVADAEDEENKTEMIVQGPVFKATSALGRCTRGYVSVPMVSHADEDSEPLFLKDTWRVNHHLMTAEAEVYKLLEKYGVPHVPRLLCGGDVKDSNGNVQKTVSVDWVAKQELKISYEPLREHTHHRIVQRVAYPIESADNSREFVEAFINVFEGESMLLCAVYEA
jgi:hypothetical protein